MRPLSKYKELIGEKKLNQLYEDASPLVGKHFVHINSTHYGGGVAEILNSLVHLMNDVGMKTGWRVIKGPPDFFGVTKKFHNALQGEKIRLSKMKKKLYVECNEKNSFITHISDHECIIIHDPQPLPFINFYKKKQPWIWRCHIDVSSPNKQVWNYLKKFIEKYDAAIFSHQKFVKELKIPSYIIPPSIDPFTAKNEPVSESKCKSFLSKKGVDLDKPIIAQISRFDKWKDFPGVIKAFEMLKKKFDCRLVLLGNTADDDPEGKTVYDTIAEKTKGNDSITLLTENNDFLVNVLQRNSTVILQKSLKEGFGLTISESLWKETPVIASNVGGIPLQVINGKTGYLINTPEQCAKRTLKLLKDDKLRERLGRAGREHVRNNFLTTRHLQDYLNLFKTKEIFQLL